MASGAREEGPVDRGSCGELLACRLPPRPLPRPLSPLACGWRPLGLARERASDLESSQSLSLLFPEDIQASLGKLSLWKEVTVTQDR